MFEALQSIPISTIFMFSLAALISCLTSAVNRVLSDPEKAKSARKEIAAWNSGLREAQKAGDKKTVDKLMKKQREIMQLQTKMMWQSMKVTLLFLVPLFIIWYFLGGFFSGRAIAYFPGIGATLPFPSFLASFSVSLVWWYMLCSLFMGTVFSHLLGLIEIE
jgi:uncharacterized membrane protein (DUF106 family)